MRNINFNLGFSINLEKGSYKCLRGSCGVKGHINTLSKLKLVTGKYIPIECKFNENEFMTEMSNVGNYRLSCEQMDQLADKVLENKGKHWLITKNFAGKNANVLANELHINLDDNVPLLFGETSKNHPWVVADD